MFTPEILQVAETKMKNSMHLTTAQLAKAHRLVAADQVKPFKSSRFPDNFQVHSQSRDKTYSPNLSTLDCQCEHGNNQRSMSIDERTPCAHIHAAFLYRYCVNEQARVDESQSWQAKFDEIAVRVSQPMNPQIKQYLNEQGAK